MDRFVSKGEKQSFPKQVVPAREIPRGEALQESSANSNVVTATKIKKAKKRKPEEMDNGDVTQVVEKKQKTSSNIEGAEQIGSLLRKTFKQKMPTWAEPALNFARVCPTGKVFEDYKRLIANIALSEKSMVDTFTKKLNKAEGKTEVSSSSGSATSKEAVSASSSSSELFSVNKISCVTPFGKCDLQFATTHLTFQSTGKINKKFVVSLDNIEEWMKVSDKKTNTTYHVLSLKQDMEVPDQHSTKENSALSLFVIAVKTKEKQNINLIITPGSNPTLAKAVLGTADDKGKVFVADVVQRALFNTFSAISMPCTEPSREIFQSSSMLPSLKAYVKANDGLLFPLRNGLLFLRKPAVYVPIRNIDQISNSRAVNSTRSFDLLVETKDKASHEFTMIDRVDEKELGSYLQYLGKQREKLDKLAAKQKKIEKKKEEAVGDTMKDEEEEEISSSSDEESSEDSEGSDFVDGGDDDESDIDEYESDPDVLAAANETSDESDDDDDEEEEEEASDGAPSTSSSSATKETGDDSDGMSAFQAV